MTFYQKLGILLIACGPLGGFGGLIAIGSGYGIIGGLVVAASIGAFLLGIGCMRDDVRVEKIRHENPSRKSVTTLT